MFAMSKLSSVLRNLLHHLLCNRKLMIFCKAYFSVTKSIQIGFDVFSVITFYFKY